MLLAITNLYDGTAKTVIITDEMIYESEKLAQEEEGGSNAGEATATTQSQAAFDESKTVEGKAAED